MASEVASHRHQTEGMRTPRRAFSRQYSAHDSNNSATYPPLRIPEDPAILSDFIRLPVPGYPATCDALPRGSVFWLSVLRGFVTHFGDGLKHELALKFEAVGDVNDAVQNDICEGRLPDDVMRDPAE
jgi:hypothetical protein